MRFKTLGFFTIIILLLTYNLVAQNNQIIMSPIGIQETYAGGRLEVFCSSLVYNNDIQFESSDLPDFGHIENNGNGKGRIILEPTVQDIGEHLITLRSYDDIGESIQTFKFIVKPIPTDARLIYIDPVNGSMSNDGSINSPYKTLAETLTSLGSNLKGGSIIFLYSGYHGVPIFTFNHSSPIHVLPAHGQSPTVERINFSFTDNWVISGLKISPEAANTLEKRSYVNVFGGSSNIVVKNCEIYSIKNSSNWTKEDWHNYCGDGITVLGNNCKFLNNYLYNTWFPVQLKAIKNEFSYNIIDQFGADAMRGTASHQKFLYNQVTNATVDDYDNGQHDDGFQSWTFNLPIKDMVIKGNQIADLTDPNLKLKAIIMQGIVCFDGFVEDWIVEDNLVITHHSHGIALYGATNCKIVNNTVTRNPFNQFLSTHNPWIRINRHKDGRKSASNLTRNNIMSSSIQDDYPGTFDHNYIGLNYNAIYHDYNNWDFHLSNSEDVIDKGLREDASTFDADQNIREEGINIDLGCYEKEAHLKSYITPDAPESFVTSAVHPTSVSLTWENVEDALYYIVKTNDQSIKTSNHQCTITNLKPDRHYIIELYTVNRATRISNKTILEYDSPSIATIDQIEIKSVSYDQEVNSLNKSEWIYAPFFRIGKQNQNKSGILSFKIPKIPNGYVIDHVGLRLYLDQIMGNPSFQIDLYGLGHDINPYVIKTDFWQGAFDDSNAKGTALIDDLCTSTSSANIVLDSSMSVIITDYVNQLINDGADAGDYIFFRLTKDNTDNEDSYYSFYSGDHFDYENIPSLQFFIKDPTSTQTLEIKELHVFPTIIGETASFHIQLPNNISDPTITIRIIDLHGKTITRNIRRSNPSTLEINTDIIPSSGLYYIQIQDQKTLWQSEIIKL